MANYTILPNARTQFFDGNGTPLAMGTVEFFIPSTSTHKTTWQDINGNTPNTNPVDLDGDGTALIWGYGAYRQLVKDALGNTIWDAVTNGITTADFQPISSVLTSLADATYETAKTSNFSLTSADVDCTVPVNCTSGTITGTLPLAATAGGNIHYYIHKIDYASNFLTIAASGSDTIGTAGPKFTVSNAVNNGAGLIRLTIAEQRTIQTGDKVDVASVGGVTAANGRWTATRINATTIDLQGSTFSGTYTSGGTVTQIRTSIVLHYQDSFVNLVSDGVSCWTIADSSSDVAPVGRDWLFGWNPNYVGYDTSTSTWIDTDWLYSGRVQRFQCRSMGIADVGDPPDLAIRRAEGTYGAYTAPASNTNIGTIYWQALAGNTQTYEGQNAGIYCRAQGTQTSTNAAGRLVLGTTKTNELQATDGLEIDHAQWVYLGGNSSTRAVTVRQDGATSCVVLRNASSSQVNVSADGAAADVILNLISKGTAPVDIYTNSGNNVQVRVLHTASANRALTFTGSNGGNPTISTNGGNVAFGTPLMIPTSTNAAAPNSSLYYSSDASKLVWKDAAGIVNNLY